MPHPIATGDIIEHVLVTRTNQQLLLNVTHWRVGGLAAPSPAGVTGLTDFLNVMSGAGNLVVDVANVLTSDDFLVEHSAQIIKPTRYVKLVVPLGFPGFVAAATELPQNVAISITKRGDLARRGGAGRFQLLASNGGLISNGRVVDPTPGGLIDIAVDLRTTLNMSAGPIFTATPIILNRANYALSQTVSNTQVQTTARVMRRRTVGLGI